MQSYPKVIFPNKKYMHVDVVGAWLREGCLRPCTGHVCSFGVQSWQTKTYMLYNLYFWTDEKSTISGVVCLIACLLVCLFVCCWLNRLSRILPFQVISFSTFAMAKRPNFRHPFLMCKVPCASDPLASHSATSNLDSKKYLSKASKSSSLGKGKKKYKAPILGGCTVVRLHHLRGWRISFFLQDFFQ